MKSIIEEASSIAKAVERGWEKAGKPKEFTVKIFEEAKKNFIGFVVHSAKVGIFFQELPEKSAEKSVEAPRNNSSRQIQRRPLSTPSASTPHETTPARRTAPLEKKAIRPIATEAPAEPVAAPAIEWTPPMVETASDWLKGLLKSIEKGSVGVTSEVSGSTLQLFIHEQILADPQQEKHLFINFSTLIIQAIKRKTRKSLKGYRVSVFRQQ